MTGLPHDLRYSLRTLRNSPGFVLAGVLALGFSIGVNSMIFMLLNAIFLRPLPVDNASQIVTIYQILQGARGRHVHGVQTYLSYPEYQTYRDENRSLSGIVAYANTDLTLGGEDRQRVVGQLATCNYFSVLSPAMSLGRSFADEECRVPGANPVVVLEYLFWQRKFAADPNILGRTIVINGYRHTVIGVAPKEFRGGSLEPTQLWAPITMQEQWIRNRQFLDDPNLSWLQVLGRLKPGISLSEARADLSVIARRIDEQIPGKITTLVVDRATLMNNPRMRPVMLGVGALILGGVSLVLLLACANLANLLLARAANRQKEIAIRLAVGASRSRLIRQLLTESMIVSLASGGLGLLLAWQSIQFLFPFIISRLPLEAQFLALDLTPDVRILLYSVLLCIATAFGFGLLPALHASKLDLNTALKEGAGGFAYSGKRFRGALIGTQVAICLVLLIGTGLLARGVYASQTIDPGIDVQDVTVVSFDLTRQGYDEPRASEFHRQLTERIATRLGPENVALTEVVPLSGGRHQNSVEIEGREGGHQITYTSVSPSYFQLAGIPIVAGRGFDESAEMTQVAIVSESTARSFWPNIDPLGRRFRFGGTDINFVVIGVAKDVRATTLWGIDETFVYFPGSPTFFRNASLLARGTQSGSVGAMIRTEAHALDPNLLVQIQNLESNLAVFQLPSRLTAGLGAVLGVVGLLLASLGIYAMLSYAVAQRRREIGIRMSLGADAHRVQRMILWQALRPVLYGMAIGLLGAAAASRVLSSLLFGVSPLDPFIYVGVSAFLMAVACFASYAPARRAATIDPMSALRQE